MKNLQIILYFCLCFGCVFSFFPHTLLVLNQMRNKNKSTQATHNQTSPKMWQNYVRNLMERIVVNNFLDKNERLLPLNYFLESASTKMNKLLKVKQSHQLRYFKEECLWDNEKDKYKVVKVYNSVITYPLGQKSANVNFDMSRKDLTHDNCGPAWKRRFSIRKISWLFNLDPRLRLNLTVHFLYISSCPALSCTAGNFTMESGSQENTKITFCGQYSNSIYYSLSPSMTQIIFARYFVTVETNIFYSVIDLNVATSYNMFDSAGHHLKPFLFIHFLKHDFSLSSYSITVEKCERIALYLHKIKGCFVIFDGFEYNSSETLKLSSVTRNRETYLSSAFQCTLHNLARVKGYNETANIKYHGEFHKNIQQIFLEKNQNVSYSFNLTGINSTAFVLKYTVPNEMHANVSIKTLHYEGKRNTLCRNAGISAFNEFNDTYAEIATLCQPHFGGFENRQLFSKNSSLLLVLYVCDYFSSFFVEFTVSVTKCEPVVYNFFLVSKVCQSNYARKIFFEKECHTYLNKMSVQSNVFFDIYYVDSNGPASHLSVSVSVKPGTCAIIQWIFEYDETFDKLYSNIVGWERIDGDIQSGLGLSLAYKYEPGEKLHVTVEGFKKGDLVCSFLLFLCNKHPTIWRGRAQSFALFLLSVSDICNFVGLFPDCVFQSSLCK